MQSYISAIEGVGAEAIVEYPPRYDASYDGLVLCGGADIHPKWYNEEINGSVGIDTDMDEAEFALMDAFVKTCKPVLGICRGHQFVNVFFGGSLYQHIPEAELHTGSKAHLVTSEPNSILRELYGTSFSVNSTHHQAVKKLGDGLRATASWGGKYIEATEHTSLPVISVQWHPEGMCFDRKRDDTVDGAKIFEYFVNMCTRLSTV
ncbi:MAG: gamma-glutamyl-gamma-aminobutyrate hydrolase family protein [Clostridia bacterium]|nr:gamma-glutamyl-gamma-aminobutyrate hydrolase family protein [Clostridia bacterium]